MSFALLLQEQNRNVAKKLGITTLLMFTLPIFVFYVCLFYIFPQKNEPTMWSGGFAVLTANFIIVGYVISAFNEDDDNENEDEDEEEKKKRLLRGGAAGGVVQPRVGAFKTRTD